MLDHIIRIKTHLVALLLLLPAAACYVGSVSADADLANKNIILRLLVQDMDVKSGTATMSTIIDTAMRPDGTRSETKQRTYRSESDPLGFRSSEGRELFDRSERMSYSIFPALKMYVKGPAPDIAFVDRIPQASCREMLSQSNGKAARLVQEGMRFGYSYEKYILEVDMQNVPHRLVKEFEVFPSLGCVEGNRKEELYFLDTRELRSQKVVTLVHLEVAEDDPFRFAKPPEEFKSVKPSELMTRMSELRGEECSDCALESGQKFDQRYDEIWRSRQAEEADPDR